MGVGAVGAVCDPSVLEPRALSVSEQSALSVIMARDYLGVTSTSVPSE